MKFSTVIGWIGVLLYPAMLLGFILTDPTNERPVPQPLSQSEQRDALVTIEAQAAGVPTSIALAVARVENWSGDSMAVSPAGAVGLMQIMPKHWQHAFEEECGCGSLFRRQRNACVGVRILKLKYEEQGTWEAALRAYNGSLHFPTAGREYVSLVIERAFSAPLGQMPQDGTTVRP